MTLRSSDLQSDSDLDSIRNSCDVSSLLQIETFPFQIFSSFSFSFNSSSTKISFPSPDIFLLFHLRFYSPTQKNIFFSKYFRPFFFLSTKKFLSSFFISFTKNSFFKHCLRIRKSTRDLHCLLGLVVYSLRQSSRSISCKKCWSGVEIIEVFFWEKSFSQTVTYQFR